MSKKKSEHAPELSLENYQYPDKFGTWLGYKVLKLDRVNFKSEVELQIREDHLSPAKRVHGGVISSFFDFAFGAAVFSSLGSRDFCSTVELKVNYFRPLELGDRVVAKAEIVFRGKHLCALHGYAFRNDEVKPVAMATATFNIVTGKSQS